MNDIRDDRDDADLVLPWYVNDTLSATEKREVERQLEADPDLAAEEKFLRTLKASVQDRSTGSPGEFGWRRLRKDIRQDTKQTANKWWRPALAAAALVMVIQGGVIWSLIDQPGTYQPAGAELPGTILQVRFQPNTTVSQIGQLLKDVEGSIVQGPSAVGLYRVSLPEQSDVDTVVARIRQQTSVIEYVAKE